MPTPLEWGNEDHVREQFDDAVDWSFSREEVIFRSSSIDDWIEFNSRKLGPMVLARTMLEPQDKWDALAAALKDHYDRFNIAEDGSFAGRAEYLLAVGQLPA
jgi:hypothetical protein